MTVCLRLSNVGVSAALMVPQWAGVLLTNDSHIRPRPQILDQPGLDRQLAFGHEPEGPLHAVSTQALLTGSSVRNAR